MRVIKDIAALVGRPILGCEAASGTEIIERLGGQHVQSGSPIVYTSHGSVLQLAAHESITDVSTLESWGEKIYEGLEPQYAVARVIVRQFTGGAGSYKRIFRKDISHQSVPRVIQHLRSYGARIHGIGKSTDLFQDLSFDHAFRETGNEAVLRRLNNLIPELRGVDSHVVIATLDDFDAQFGHRRDPAGFAACLEQFDRQLPAIIGLLRKTDLLIITADHGTDPTAAGFGHTREFVPALCFSPSAPSARSLPDHRQIDVGATIVSWVTDDPPFGTPLMGGR